MNVAKVTFNNNSVWIEGSENGWSARQNYCDLYEVSGVIVGQSPLNQKPMFVVKNRSDLVKMLTAKWPGATFE